MPHTCGGLHTWEQRLDPNVAENLTDFFVNNQNARAQNVVSFRHYFLGEQILKNHFKNNLFDPVLY